MGEQWMRSLSLSRTVPPLHSGNCVQNWLPAIFRHVRRRRNGRTDHGNGLLTTRHMPAADFMSVSRMAGLFM